jgi:hypothetical protein
MIGANAEEPGLDEILERVIVAYGGESNLRRLNSQVQEWDIVALSSGSHGTDTRHIRVPDQLKVEVVYPHKKEARVINGTTGYYLHDGQHLRPASGPQRDAMRLQLMRLYSPLVLKQKFDSLTLSTSEEFVVITLFERGVRVDYLVNPDNWRIEKVVGSLAINRSEMQFVTEYSNFEFRDGVLVHLNENKFAGGTNTAVLELRRITLDAELADSEFMPEHHPSTSPEQERDETI